MDRRGILKSLAAVPAMLRTGVPEALAQKGIGETLIAGAGIDGPAKQPNPVVDTYISKESPAARAAKRLFALEHLQKLGYGELVEDQYLERYSNIDKYDTLRSISPIMKQVFRRAETQRNALPRQIESLKRDMKKAAMRELLPQSVRDLISGNY